MYEVSLIPQGNNRQPLPFSLASPCAFSYHSRVSAMWWVGEVDLQSRRSGNQGELAIISPDDATCKTTDRAPSLVAHWRVADRGILREALGVGPTLVAIGCLPCWRLATRATPSHREALASLMKDRRRRLCALRSSIRSVRRGPSYTILIRASFNQMRQKLRKAVKCCVLFTTYTAAEERHASPKPRGDEAILCLVCTKAAITYVRSYIAGPRSETETQAHGTTRCAGWPPSSITAITWS